MHFDHSYPHSLLLPLPLLLTPFLFSAAPPPASMSFFFTYLVIDSEPISFTKVTCRNMGKGLFSGVSGTHQWLTSPSPSAINYLRILKEDSWGQGVGGDWHPAAINPL